MEIVRGIENFTIKGGATLTVGSFDGVHSGHLSLLSTLTERASIRDDRSIVVSFTPHPRIALSRTDGFGLLTSDEEKAQLLAERGVDTLLLLEFNKAFSAMSYEEFILKYLLEKVGMRELVVGFNHHMGHNSGGYDSIATLAKEHNFGVTLAQEYSQTGDKISSTVIRQAISAGDIECATRLLSHRYLVLGHANHQGVVSCSEPLKLLPPLGFYSAEVNGELQRVEINEQGDLHCDAHNTKVEIKFTNRYETR